MWQTPEFQTPTFKVDKLRDLVTYTEEILNGKVHFFTEQQEHETKSNNHTRWRRKLNSNFNELFSQ